MKITDIIWLARFVEKIEQKHGVSTDEVEQVFANRPQIRLIERGDVNGEKSLPGSWPNRWWALFRGILYLQGRKSRADYFCT